MSQPMSPPPVTASGTDDLPAYVSNGIIGLRVLDVPLLPGMMLVNGFAGMDPSVQVEAAAAAPYAVAGDIALNGSWLRIVPHQATFVDQAYDFSNGELTTRFRYAANGATANVEVLTFCSRKQPTIVAQEVSVEVDTGCELTLRSLIDLAGVSGRVARRDRSIPGRPDEHFSEGSLAWESLGGLGRCGIAYATELRGDETAEKSTPDWGIDQPLLTEYAIRARPGRAYRMRQIASVVPDVLHHDPDRAATRLAGRAASHGFDELRRENRAAWEELWRSRILIDADDDRWQALSDAAFFYLNSSVHPSAPSSTSIFGLATWHDYNYYYGHVMWDIEAFCVPPLTLLQPDAAYTLLEFRTQTLRAARSNAKLHGRGGIEFPWESGPLRGEEVAPGAGRASWHEDHVTLDIAWAYSQYAHVTGDRRFLAEQVAPVLYDVAEWIGSRVTPTRSGFAWRQTMGIAERERASDNEAFTIMAAKRVLAEAIDCAERLGHTVPSAWSKLRAGLEPPISPGLGAVMSHDGFHPREEKGSTPGPLFGLFPFGYELDPGIEKATIEYYLSLAPGYIGSPMLSPLYGVWAAWADDRRASARLLEQGYADLVAGRFLQTLEQLPANEPDKPKAGPFFANLGGFLMGLLYGLPGLRVGPAQPETWPSRRVVLPAGWRTIEVEQMSVRRQQARLIAAHGAERAEIVLPSSRRRRAA
ncbi:MAG TPA: glycoside hydrolase family 65 protein [Candidatus Limnocylindria bacterium]|nr:glycoside hydrolase family 65 protein [Candidatus Limnocylindria bacterium]